MISDKTQKTDKAPRRIVKLTLFVILMAAVVYLIVSGVHKAQEAAFNSDSYGKMGWFAYMLSDYQNFHGHFPPPVTFNEEGQAMHSWRTIILRRYLPEFVDGYDFSLPWDSPENLEFARNNVPPPVQYPVDAHGTAPNYMLAIGEGCLYSSRDAKPESLYPPGSTEPVLVLVESSRDDVLWTEPVDVEGVTEANPFVRPENSEIPRKRATVLYYKPKEGFQSGTEGEAAE